MRKVDPVDVRADFRVDVLSLMAYMNRARMALEGESHEKGDVSRLATTSFLPLYVRFERFLSDLFLAYLNRNFSRYQSWTEGRIEQSVEQRIGQWAKDRLQFNTVKHVKVHDLESIVDPEGRNLTFRDTDKMKLRAREWLSPQHANRLTNLADHDCRLIDTARAIRDFIAHRSPGSRVRMNAMLRTVAAGGHNGHLGRGKKEVQNVGVYLKAVRARKRRVAIYAQRLNDISTRM